MKINQIMYPQLKHCPWCGEQGTYIIDSLEKENGRGYPGHHSIYIECSNPECRAHAPNGKFDDLGDGFQTAVLKAAASWNTRTTMLEK